MAGVDQEAIFAFLENPATHGIVGPVRRIETHGAVVFLAGPLVYKVKRALAYSYMDFSTLDKRRAACEAELAVNHANAPDIYLDATPIVRRGAALAIDGEGEIVEWAVRMRRFDENATCDRLAERGPLGETLIRELAQTIVAAHRRAPARDGRTATADLHRRLVETLDELREIPDLFPPAAVAALAAALLGNFDRLEPVLLRRGAQKQVRRGHGDLHLGNIVVLNGAPVLFDAIEFDDAIATTDVLYDLAFVLMDLWRRGLRGDANLLLNRYLCLTDDPQLQIDGLAALPMFMSLRAAIRAKVRAAALRLESRDKDVAAEAAGFFANARIFLEPSQPRLVAIGGRSGAGKSTVAAAIAPAVGRAPGAVHLRSDVERKRLFGVNEAARLPDSAYRPYVSRETYERLFALAESALQGGQSVVLDAAFLAPGERRRAAALASKLQIPFAGFWLDAAEAVLARRVSERGVDASDATARIVAAQGELDTGRIEWRRIDAGRDLAPIVGAVLEALENRAPS